MLSTPCPFDIAGSTSQIVKTETVMFIDFSEFLRGEKFSCMYIKSIPLSVVRKSESVNLLIDVSLLCLQSLFKRACYCSTLAISERDQVIGIFLCTRSLAKCIIDITTLSFFLFFFVHQRSSRPPARAHTHTLVSGSDIDKDWKDNVDLKRHLRYSPKGLSCVIVLLYYYIIVLSVFALTRLVPMITGTWWNVLSHYMINSTAHPPPHPSRLHGTHTLIPLAVCPSNELPFIIFINHLNKCDESL